MPVLRPLSQRDRSVKNLSRYKQVSPAQRYFIIKRQGKKRILHKHDGWRTHTSSLQQINQTFGFPSKWKLQNVIRRLASVRTSKNPLVVLDWGCGNGRALRELEKMTDPSTTRLLGYSDVSYPEWNKVTRTRIIYENKHDLLRYIKPGSLGVIFSHLGILHLIDKNEYVVELAKKLEIGGLFFLDEGQLVKELEKETLERAGIVRILRADIKRGYAGSIYQKIR